MTVHELSQYLSRLDPNMEVKLATQPTYPIRENIANVAVLPSEPNVVWLAGEQDYDKPYAPSEAWS